MSETRVRKVEEQIKKEVGQIIGEELKDPRLSAAMTSVTGVRVSRDLRYARIYVSVYGTDGEKERALQALHRATGFVRTEIGRRIRLRFVPEISFHLDSSLEYGAHIERVLRDIHRDGESEC